MYLGDQVGGHGVYDMQSGTLDGWHDTRTVENDGVSTEVTQTWYGGIVLGEWGGYGDFNHSGGTVHIDNLTIARQENSVGHYNLSGDATVTLTVEGQTVVGARGSGFFDQTDGTHTTGGLTIGGSGVTVILDDNTGEYKEHWTNQGQGIYTLDTSLPDGDSSILWVKGDLVLGDGGTGTFQHTNGRVTVDGDMILGRKAVYDVSDGQGTTILTENLYGNGTYNLDSGELLVKGDEYVGYSTGSYGTFNQNGGDHWVDNTLFVDVYARSKGEYNLYSGNLNIGTDTIVGSSGDGTFNQSGGLHNVGGNLIVGQTAKSWGTYNLSNKGMISVGGSAIVGQEGKGHFYQSGGTVTVVNDLILGQAAGATGTYDLSGGNLNIGIDTIVGSSGYGTFNQRGGVHNVGRNLIVGQGAGIWGDYDLGDGEVSVGGWAIVGQEGTGYFNQSGGIHDVGDNLIIGNLAGSTGVYDLSGGTLYTQDTVVGGTAGTGTFTQSYGTHIVTEQLYIGGGAAATGTYTLTGGLLDVGAGGKFDGIYVGNSGTGTFNQSGGIVLVGINNDDKTLRSDGPHELIVGRLNGSSGTYNLSGGELYSARTIIGDQGSNPSLFEHTDGSHKVYQDMIIGQDSSTGTYNLSGSAELEVQRAVYLGDEGGTGIFNQSGGTNIIHRNLEIGSSSESGTHVGTGTYNMTGGTLSVTNEIINNGLFKGAGGNITTGLFTNNGTVAPGHSPGTLTMTGNYVQNAAGILEIELGGTNPGEYDILNIIGSATLGGILDISLYGGYSPANGTAFDFLLASGGITGEFSSIAGPTGWVWNVAYLDLIGSDGKIDTARLTANAVPIPAALWLFGAGLLGLIGIRRRLKA